MNIIETLTFREGTQDDHASLMQLGIVSYAQFSTELTEDNWNKLNTNLNDKKALTALIEMSKVFVCEAETIVGMAYLVPKGNPTVIFESDWAYIRMVGVDPKYRGRGIAKKLTQMCIEYAKQTGEKTIALHTSEMMNDARHIYESLGFQQSKELVPILGRKYWLYKLELAKED